MKLALVRDWMTRELITADATMGVLEAEKLMRDNEIRRLPVLKNGRLVGIVTHGDLREARPSSASSLNQWELSYLLTRLQLSEVMTEAVLTVSPDTTIGEASQKMLERRIGALPVIDANGNLVGIITESDVFRMVVHDWLRAQEDSTKPYAHYNE